MTIHRILANTDMVAGRTACGLKFGKIDASSEAERTTCLRCKAAVRRRTHLRPRTPAKSINLSIPKHLVDAINKYLDTNWTDGRDPSKIGALNAVAYIGEQVAAIFKKKRPAARVADSQ